MTDAKDLYPGVSITDLEWTSTEPVEYRPTLRRVARARSDLPPLPPGWYWHMVVHPLRDIGAAWEMVTEFVPRVRGQPPRPL